LLRTLANNNVNILNLDFGLPTGLGLGYLFQASRFDVRIEHEPRQLGRNFFLGSRNSWVATGPNPRTANEMASNISAQTYLNERQPKGYNVSASATALVL
jgi:hypothetical protein